MGRVVVAGCLLVTMWGCGGATPQPGPPPAGVADSAPAPLVEPQPLETESYSADPTAREAAGEDAGRDDPERPPSRAEIARVVKSAAARVRSCHQVAGADAPGGKLVMHIEVSPEGRVVAARRMAERSSIVDADLSACVARSLVGLEFSSGPAAITYPFVFFGARDETTAIAVALIKDRFHVKGAIDHGAVLAVMKSAHGSLRRCYVDLLAKHPDLVGGVDLSFRIDERGRAVQITTQSTTPGLRNCVVGVVKQLRFPRAPAGDLVEVRYPLRFRQPDPA